MHESIVDEVLPLALTIGVDYDLFWVLNPKSLQPFVKAFQMKKRLEDEFAWSQGGYIRMAIASSLSKDAKYPRVPLLAKKQDEVPQEIIKDNFLRHVKLINSSFNK